MAKKATSLDLVLKATGSRKSGITAEQVAIKTGVPLSTVRSYLTFLRKQGSVEVIDTVRTGNRGRPALVYVSA
jgi:predicted ArsR family transcriptional regulator